MVDLKKKVIQPGRGWQMPEMSPFMCPFCEGAIKPSRIILSRAILVIGVMLSMPSGILLASLLVKSPMLIFGFNTNDILSSIAVIFPAIGLLLSLYCSKAVVLFNKHSS